jgi:hypothetical protein
VDPREERLAKNEIVFRDVNERIEHIANPRGSGDAHVFHFLCECSNVDCTLRLPLTLADYEAVRSNPTWFVVAPGHELPEIEEVVARRDHYQVVMKRGEAAVMVAKQDPRG